MFPRDCYHWFLAHLICIHTDEELKIVGFERQQLKRDLLLLLKERREQLVAEREQRNLPDSVFIYKHYWIDLRQLMKWGTNNHPLIKPFIKAFGRCQRLPNQASSVVVSE